MSSFEVPTFVDFVSAVAAVAPRLGDGVASGRVLDRDLGFTTADVARLDLELFRRHRYMLGLDGRAVDWLGLTVGQAYALFVDRVEHPVDRRREALSDPVRKTMMGRLREQGLSRRELQLRFPGTSPTQINYHLAFLRAADLVGGPDAEGRYRALPS